MAQPVPGNFSVQTRTFLLVPIRVFVGALFIRLAIDQFGAGWYKGEAMREAWQPYVNSMQWAQLRDFLTENVLGHSATAGGILMVLEVLVGALLVVGLSVRLASLIGMAHAALHAVVFGYSVRLVPVVGGEEQAAQVVRRIFDFHTQPLGLYGLMFLVLLAFLLTGAGRSFGLDGMVWRRRARRAVKAAEKGEEAPAESTPPFGYS